MSSSTRAFTLAVALAAAGTSLFWASPRAEASWTARGRAEARVTCSRKAKAGKVDSKSVIKWYKSGLTDDEIVARAEEGGFKRTALARGRLEKARIPASLIDALFGEAPAAHASAKPGKAAKAEKAEAGMPDGDAGEAKAEPKADSKTVIKWYKSGLSNDEIVAKADEGGFKKTVLARNRLEKAHVPAKLISALFSEHKSEAVAVASSRTLPSKAVEEEAPAPAPEKKVSEGRRPAGAAAAPAPAPAPASASPTPPVPDAPAKRVVVAPPEEKKPAKKIDLRTVREEDIDFDSVPPPKGMPGWVEKEDKAREAKQAEAVKAAAEPPKPRSVVVPKD